MAYCKYKLGDLVEQYDEINQNGEFTEIEDLQGINSNKYFQECKSNKNNIDLLRYRICRHGMFSYNRATSRNGEKISIALRTGDDCIVSPSYYCFRVKDEDVLCPEYLDIWFKRPVFDKYARFNSWGSATEFFTFDDFCATEIMLPPLPEQRKIVHDYQVIMNRIELLRKMNDNLTEQCSVDYNLMLNGYTTESEELPDGWNKGSIGSYCDVKSGFAFKSNWWTTEGYKVIKIANIVNNSIDLDSCDCVIAEHANKANNFYVQSGDILIAMTGATTGKIGMVPLCSEPIVVNQRVGKFFLGDNPIEKAPFLFATLLYSRVIRHLQPDGTAGSAQDNLSADNIKDVAIVLPEQTVIDTFNQQHIPHIKTIMSNCAEIRLLNKLSETVLQTLSSR